MSELYFCSFAFWLRKKRSSNKPLSLQLQVLGRLYSLIREAMFVLTWKASESLTNRTGEEVRGRAGMWQED